MWSLLTSTQYHSHPAFSPIPHTCQVYSSLQAFHLCIEPWAPLQTPALPSFSSCHSCGNSFHAAFDQDLREYASTSLWTFSVHTFPNCDLGSPQNSFRSHSFTAQKYRGVRFPWGHHWPMVTYWWINASSSYSLGRQFWQTFRKFCRIFLWPIQRCIFILAFLCSVVLLCISPVSRDHFLNKWFAYKFLSQAVLLWRTEAKTTDTQNRIVLQSSQALKKGSWSWFTHQSWQTPHCCL